MDVKSKRKNKSHLIWASQRPELGQDSSPGKDALGLCVKLHLGEGGRVKTG